MPHLVSVRAGRIRTYPVPGSEKTWTTAFFKEALSGPQTVDTLGIEGDQQAEKRFHGGPEMALLGYSAEHYPTWTRETGLKEMGPGGFGENLTLSGLDETTVCIGDTYEIGGITVQVSQPRGPCSKIEKRWNCDGLVKMVSERGWTGWYMRVLKPGQVEAGQEVRLVERPYPQLTVSLANQAKRNRKTRRDLVELFVACPLAAETFRRDLQT